MTVCIRLHPSSPGKITNIIRICSHDDIAANSLKFSPRFWSTARHRCQQPTLWLRQTVYFGDAATHAFRNVQKYCLYLIGTHSVKRQVRFSLPKYNPIPYRYNSSHLCPPPSANPTPNPKQSTGRIRDGRGKSPTQKQSLQK